MADKEFSYNEVTYPSYVFPQTSPERLAAVAIFHGSEPADPKHCRFLELGCGNGANLLLHASNFPDSEFTGIDLAAEHIKEGEAFRRELDIQNLKLIQMDVMNFTGEGFGRFDYIIAHGLYSWVPDLVRDKVDSIFGECLSPNGIGYISYNVYPGCHAREMIWNMLRFHSRKAERPIDKLRASLEYLKVFREQISNPQFKEMIEQEIDTFAGREAENIFHDDLSSLNRPFYFFEFAERMSAAGLQYMCELPAMAVSDIERSAEEATAIESLHPADLVEREQYSDFIQMQRFRSSLICRSGIEVKRQPSPEVLGRLRFFTDVRPKSDEPDVLGDGSEVFLTTTNRGFSIDHPPTKAALLFMAGSHPRSFGFDQLVEASTEVLGKEMIDDDINVLGNFVLMLAAAGPILFRLFEPEICVEVSSRPTAAGFTRWQAVNGSNSLTNQAGYNIKPNNPAVLHLVSLLDGTRGLDELVKAMSSQYEVPDPSDKEFIEDLKNVVKAQLQQLAQCGLLIA